MFLEYMEAFGLYICPRANIKTFPNIYQNKMLPIALTTTNLQGP